MTDEQHVHVTIHAIERYIERVAPVTPEQAATALDSPAVRCAAEIGARFVRLHGGQRIVLQGWTVVTVMPSENYRKQVRRRGMGRYGASGRIGQRFDEVE
jgi:hypothetical protein